MRHGERWRFLEPHVQAARAPSLWLTKANTKWRPDENAHVLRCYANGKFSGCVSGDLSAFPFSAESIASTFVYLACDHLRTLDFLDCLVEATKAGGQMVVLSNAHFRRRRRTVAKLEELGLELQHQIPVIPGRFGRSVGATAVRFSLTGYVLEPFSPEMIYTFSKPSAGNNIISFKEARRPAGSGVGATITG